MRKVGCNADMKRLEGDRAIKKLEKGRGGLRLNFSSKQIQKHPKRY